MKRKMIKGLSMGVAMSLAFSSFCLASYAEDEDVATTSNEVIFKSYIGKQFDKETDTVFVGENVKVGVLLDNFESLYGVENAMQWNPDVMTLMTVDKNGEYVPFGGYDSAEDPDSAADPTLVVVDQDEDIACSGEHKHKYGFGMSDDFVWDLCPGVFVSRNEYSTLCADINKGQFFVSAFFEPRGISIPSGTNTEFLHFIFQAKKEGKLEFKHTAGIRNSIPNGINLTRIGSNVAVTDFNIVNLNTQILKEPVAPAVATWNGNTASWESEANRGFILQLYQDGKKLGDEISIGEDVNSYDFSDVIGSENKTATYTYSVVAKGAQYNSKATLSTENVVELSLEKPKAPEWKGSILSWGDAVKNAEEYVIQLYKDGKKQDDVIVIDNLDINKEVDLSENLTEPGEYAATIIARAKGYKDSDESDKTSKAYCTGSTIKGTIAVKDGLMEGATHPEYKLPNDIQVELYNGNTKVCVAIVNTDSKTFTFKNVPEGDYKIKISGRWIKARTSDLSVKGNKSYSMPVLQLIYGDMNDSGAIDAFDLTSIKTKISQESDEFHFINEGSVVSLSEFAHICRFINADYKADDLQGIVLQ